MHKIFINIYSVLKSRKSAVLVFIILLCGGIGTFISQSKFEEDITSLIPMDERIAQMNETFSSSKFADQLVFIISLSDTALIDEDRLILEVDSLANFLQTDTSYIKAVRSSVDESAISFMYDFFYTHMPLFMTDEDYEYVDSVLEKENLTALMQNNYKSIISPTGFATARYILKDPLSITPRFLTKLQKFELDKNFVLHQSRIFTKDKKQALVFVDPKYSSKNTQMNRELIRRIDQYIGSRVGTNSDIHIQYYGGTAVAVANADRVQKDILITVSIASILLILLFVFVFRNIKVLALMFMPVVLGVGISLAILSLMYSSVSAIALGVGAVLIGISIDFSLHYFSHVRIGHSNKSILSAISQPVIMSSITTASAFLCLSVVNSEALNQLGAFAGMSVVATSIVVLVVLPLFFKSTQKTVNTDPQKTFVDTWASYAFHEKRVWLYAVVVLTIIFGFTSKYLKFDADIANLNYLPDHLSESEQVLKRISSEASSAVYIVTSGSDIDEALEKVEKTEYIFKDLERNGSIDSYNGVTTLLLSAKRQQSQIDKWNTFWKQKGIDSVKNRIVESGKAYRFKENAFVKFLSLITTTPSTLSDEDATTVKQLFLSNLIDQKEDKVSLVSVCKVEQNKKAEFFRKIDGEDFLVLDKQFFTNRFFDVLNEDFSRLINYSMIVVFLIILLFWGRIELAIITFLPIVLSWQWTIGLMGLLGVEFNIFNIIICTFIFGLGVDYSIFLTQGLLDNFKYGNRSIHPYKVSILLSVCTTLIGVGVLIFAQHPAIKSIAAVTILGIISVIIITFTLIPFLFNWLVGSKKGKRPFPIIMFDMVISITTFLTFLLGIIIISVLVLLFQFTPFFQSSKKKIIHYLVFLTCKLVVGVNFLFDKSYLDVEKFDLSKPSVIMCNHQSHLDIALILMLSPKIIVLTNEWVWKNPLYGHIIRYIEFYPIYTGIDDGYDKIKSKVDQGYSVLIFPEGTRTKDGKITRFHQGAFSLADYLGLDLLPVLLHGAYEAMPKTDFFLRAGKITLKFYDRITVDPVDIDNGITYRKQAKEVTKFYRKEFANLRSTNEDVDFFVRKLRNQYVFKGPVLEWYLRVKLSLEKRYRFYDELLPRTGKIIDVGCGYGFMTNMLSYTSSDRQMVGWDYDSEKISVASEVASENPMVHFQEKDIVVDGFEQADVFVFNDVLHYFSENTQFDVLSKAKESLSENGMIVIRDADIELKKRTKVTALTEFFSIKLLGFNKLKYSLSFVSSKAIEKFAHDNQLSFRKVDNAKYTSNLTYILEK